MKNKIFKNVFLMSVTVFSVCMVLFVVLFYGVMSDVYADDLRQQFAYISAAAESGNITTLEKTADESSLSIILKDNSGEVVFENIHNPEKTIKEELTGVTSDGGTVTVYTVTNKAAEQLAKLLLPLTVVLFAAVAVSLLAASVISKKIVKPVTDIDSENPDSRAVYSELKPIVSRLEKQNVHIHYQDVEMKKVYGEQDDMRREFTANVSHELKTPLTTISGIAEIMSQGIIKNEDIPHFANTIYKETQRMITLVGDIIKLSQMDESAVHCADETVEMYELCEDISKRLKPLAENSGVTVTVDGVHAEVICAAQIVDEMIYNLCDNAIKYNKTGGYVRMSVSETKKHVSVLVEDSGIGIPSKDLNRIFERFYRVDKSHSKQIGGTGLGLSIVKHGAMFHGAEISVESELQKGTKIKVTFKKNKDFT